MADKVSVKQLTGVPRTLMFPVYARAKENQINNPIITDTYSADMLEKIDFDFSIFENMPDSKGFSKSDLQTGIAVRTDFLDKGVKAFLKENPNGLVVNLGCGLDARFFRLDNGTMNWIDVDLPEVIEVREAFFKSSDRYTMSKGSVLDEGWLEDISDKNGQGILIVAEGTLMYFKEEVKTLFNCLIAKFPKVTLLFEVMGSALSGKVHPSVKCLGEEIACPWGIHAYKALETWNPELRLIRSDIFIDQHRKRWSTLPRLITRLFPRQKPKFGHAILQMEVGS